MRSLRWLVALLPLLAACSCDETIGSASGTLSAVPATLDFAGVFVGDRAEQELKLHNDGRTAVMVQAVDLPEGYTVQPEQLQVGASSDAIVKVAFKPPRVARFDGKIVFAASGSKNNKLEVPIVGEGLSRELVVDSVLNFGPVLVGTEKTMDLPVSSAAGGTVHVSAVITGSEASSFELSQTEFDLEPGAQLPLQVTFSPIARVPHYAVLSFTSCQGCAETMVQLRGQGAVVDLRPEPITVAFGQVSPGHSQTLPLRLHNAGDLPVMVSRLVFAQDGDPSFGGDFSAFPVEIAQDEKQEVQVTFAPPAGLQELGDKASRILVYGADDELLFEVPTTGNAGGPDVLVDPMAVDFGVNPLGVRTTRQVTISNLGPTSPVQIRSIRLAGANPNAFELQLPPLPADVTNTPMVVGVSYKSAAMGTAFANLVIETSDADSSSVVVPLSGEVRNLPPCEIDFQPGSVRFGLVANGGEYERTVQIHNRGNDDCAVWGFGLDPNGSSFFELKDPPTATQLIAPGGSLPITVRFVPTGLPDHLETTRFFFNHTNSTTPKMQVDVSGYPSRYDLVANPNPVAFGDLPLGYRSFQSLQITNAGPVPADLVSASLATESSVNFRVAQGLGIPGTLQEGQTAAVAVTYGPDAEKQDRGEAEFWIQNAPEPFLVPLMGGGIDQPCGDLCAWPTATCPAAQTVNVNTQVILAGGGSDPAGDPLTCSWIVTNRPSGSRVVPDQANNCVTPFTPDLVGDYDLELIVMDPMGNTASCTTQVHANPFGGLWVEMFWDVNSDVDLHVVHPSAGSATADASYWTSLDCYYGNRTPDWDVIGNVNDDPSLDRDDTQFTGPENTRINVPVAGNSYGVSVHWWSAGSNTMTNVTTNVYCGGALLNHTVTQLTANRQMVNVGSVNYSAGNTCTWTSNGYSWTHP